MTADAYTLLAQQHRPSDPARLAAEVVRLHNDLNLTTADISTALRMSHDDVVNILSSPPTQVLPQ